MHVYFMSQKVSPIQGQILVYQRSDADKKSNFYFSCFWALVVLEFKEFFSSK